jgi:DNA-binding SARP family transcriptional activator
MSKSANPELNTSVDLKIQTLGAFRIWVGNQEIPASAWSREKALHLFQFLITTRQRFLHKEQIIDRLWPGQDATAGDRDFKVALHALTKVLEPDRKPRAQSRFIQRFDLTYGLNSQNIWIDANNFEALIASGNSALPADPTRAAIHFQQALQLYKGDYLPERRFEDWASTERERLQVLALGLMTTLAELLLPSKPLETIRLAQLVLTIDPVWENAYRLQMEAYMAQGNRPMAIRTYQQCKKTLVEELGIPPLPETDTLYHKIIGQTNLA